MKKLVVANWKANPRSLAEAKRLFATTKKAAARLENIEVIVCPPYPYIPFFKPGKNLKLAGQNCFWQAGPFTGEVSASMLKSVGCEYVILGHSERRQFFGETDEIINRKIIAVLGASLKVLVFLGEQKPVSLEKGLKEIRQQFEIRFKKIGKHTASKLVLVYEPAFAISTAGGKPLLAKEAAKRIGFLGKLLQDKFGKTGERIKILYGGSVDEKNVMSFIKRAGVDGLVVGAASLDSRVLTKILGLI